MSVEDFEDERRYREAAATEGKQRVFETPVRSLHVRKAVLVSPVARAAEAVPQLLAAWHAGVLAVDHDGRLLGIFTERDLLQRVVSKGLDPARTKLQAVMTKAPESLTLDDTLGYALHKMTVGEYRSVPVVDDEGKAYGVLTQQEGVKALAALFPSAVFNQPPRSFEQKPPKNQYGG